ncbi:MAG: hypothetical protein M3137_15980 [Actinomycetota bacterium]|nr:hypothetical protein [Actinomycetota bacterium]
MMVYAAWPSGAAGRKVYTFDPTSSKSVELSGTSVCDDQPAFSPDGKTIAYRYANDVWTMNADGSAKKRLVQLSGGAGSPSWSPDGTKLTFGGDDTGQSRFDIWTVKPTVAERVN